MYVSASIKRLFDTFSSGSTKLNNHPFYTGSSISEYVIFVSTKVRTNAFSSLRQGSTGTDRHILSDSHCITIPGLRGINAMWDFVVLSHPLTSQTVTNNNSLLFIWAKSHFDS